MFDPNTSVHSITPASGVFSPPVFCELRLADVKVDRFAFSEGKSPDSLSRLVESPVLASWGLLSPIGVDSEGFLIYGRKRLEAHRILGRETISARVYPAESLDADARALLDWEDNTQGPRRDLESAAAILRAAKPVIEETRRATQRRNGLLRAADMWGQDALRHGVEVEGGTVPPAIPDDDTDAEVGGGVVPPSILATLRAPGKTRDKVRELLKRDERTVNKFNDLVAWSEDTSLPAAARAAVAKERVDANLSDQVDGHHARAKKLVEQATATPEVVDENLEAAKLIRTVLDKVTLTEDKLVALGAASMASAGRLDQVFVDDLVLAQESAARIAALLEAAVRQVHRDAA